MFGLSLFIVSCLSFYLFILVWLIFSRTLYQKKNQPPGTWTIIILKGSNLLHWKYIHSPIKALSRQETSSLPHSVFLCLPIKVPPHALLSVLDGWISTRSLNAEVSCWAGKPFLYSGVGRERDAVLGAVDRSLISRVSFRFPPWFVYFKTSLNEIYRHLHVRVQCTSVS